MSGWEHPAYEELLLLESGELDGRRVEPVERHLAACPECRDRCRKLRSVQAAVAAAGEGLGNDTSFRSAAFRRARPAIAVLTAAAIATYLLTEGTTAARADELLARAAMQQTRDASAAETLWLQGDGGECYVTPDGGLQGSAGAGESQFCASLATALGSSGWAGRELLSARRFQQWRDSLGEKEDSIRDEDGATEVTTTTTEGALRRASLRVRASDYVPIAARYELELDAATIAAIHVTEVNGIPDPAPPPFHPPVPSEMPPPEPEPEISAVDPRDEIEARIRLALHGARVDGNLQIALERRENAFRVWGVASNEDARHAITRGVEGIASATASVVTEAELYRSEREVAVPWTAYQGDSQPLAGDRLGVLFRNDPAGRQECLNDLDAATRLLLGLAKDRDALKALAGRSVPDQTAAELLRAAADFDPAVEALLKRIAGRLEPLSGPLEPGPGGNLSHAEAAELYELVHQTVFLSSSAKSITLTEALERISALLR